MEINYSETTGPFRRVGVFHSDEESACQRAMDYLGTETTPVMTDLYSWGWEVIFEVADL